MHTVMCLAGGLRDTVVDFDPWAGDSLGQSLTKALATCAALLLLSASRCHVAVCAYLLGCLSLAVVPAVVFPAGTGCGWTFSPCDAAALQGALSTAISTYKVHTPSQQIY